MVSRLARTPTSTTTPDSSFRHCGTLSNPNILICRRSENAHIFRITVRAGNRRQLQARASRHRSQQIRAKRLGAPRKRFADTSPFHRTAAAKGHSRPPGTERCRASYRRRRDRGILGDRRIGHAFRPNGPMPSIQRESWSQPNNRTPNSYGNTRNMAQSF